jgi:aminomethyltransferase
MLTPGDDSDPRGSFASMGDPSAPALRRPPLHDRHVELGARLAEFGGWQMPLEYPGGIVGEHTAVREAVGVFDVSHLGKVRITGAGALELADRVLTNGPDPRTNPIPKM